MAKILIVDDDGALRTLFGLCFLRRGHSIVVASNGAEGLACVTAQAPDLVVTDVNMPVTRASQWAGRTGAAAPAACERSS